METLQTAEHIPEGNKSSSLLYKQIQCSLFRQKGTAAPPQQQDKLGPSAASNNTAVCGDVTSFHFNYISSASPQHSKDGKMQETTCTDLVISSHQEKQETAPRTMKSSVKVVSKDLITYNFTSHRVVQISSFTLEASHFPSNIHS